MDDNERYIDGQMDRVRPSDDHGQFLVKFGGQHSETKWLNITPEQYAEIRMLLTGRGVVHDI
jgi:hypothetical protein